MEELIKVARLVTALILILPEIYGKHCRYLDGNGIVRTFQCHPLEMCCGTRCCEQLHGFYRMWYFWLCMMLALMFCSGGGYWYRRRVYQRHLYSTTVRFNEPRNFNEPRHQSRTLMFLSAFTPQSCHYTTSNSLHPGPVSHSTTLSASPWGGGERVHSPSVYPPHGAPLFSAYHNDSYGVHSGQPVSPLDSAPPSYADLVLSSPTPPPTYAMAMAKSNTTAS